MELEFIRFERLEAVWKAMEGQARWAFVFWEYLRHVVRSTRRNPLVGVRIACVLEDGNVLMIVPLQKRGKTWRMLGDVPGCDIADALFLPGIGPERTGECVRFFLDRMAGRMELNRIPEGSPSGMFL